MLYIMEGAITEAGSLRGVRWVIGDPMPAPVRRVLTIQADGQELELLLGALQPFANRSQ